ncbi:hypothetical protein SERLA73DRAFT_113780 [Serpula lacrymans var. lacrymans S7.3]|uniref:Peptidase A1 domain-containing protein n=2 Tax=Serpula lacrymans var. lacrymans TaxID=341189 RepID=F8Q8Z1_SERL3|nr:uncharacterized protein SERLADRAFT_441879 [Serpula lacrymans var. lacrymans S7.9]EGN95046.1 hypothetical protein SERLA73DRAFT_113780 [Serpula lacrymans var. lacrymans S7.3]EGO20534.1 hypothetical protein SERLADRAFT_441879 [Serpula lacrymans var. lacrymans S7.9]
MWGKVVLVLIALPSLLLKAVADSPLIYSTSGQTVKLQKRPSPISSNEGWESRARNLRNAVLAKYGGTTSQPSRRSSGTDLVGNQGDDISYFASLAIGTPPALFDVTLDTGSSLLWVNATPCDIDGTQVVPYNTALSSTSQNLSDPFSSSYGSGTVSGMYAQDTVQMAGFAVEKQMFGIVNSTSVRLANCPVSGLVGLGWQQPGDPMPFWQTLADSGVWDSPVMAFQISHYPPSASNVTRPGGTFTMGFLNDSLYVGNIDYQPILDNLAPYWALPITSITVQNTSIEIPTGSAYGAIDTGTSLVVGPSAQIQAIYAQIPGSQPCVGLEGFYSYPCDTQVNVSISFGGPSWFINSSDFRYAYIDSNGSSCLGAFYEVTSSTPWVIGDTFLKSVYSVFRYSPPSVGFATLSETVLALNGANGSAPTPSVGPVLTSVTASASVANETSTSAAWRLRPFFVYSLVLAAVSGTITLI